MDQLISIHKLSEEDAVRITASPDEPHIHDYEELVVMMEGELEHFIDFKLNVFCAPMVCFVTKGKTHRLIPRLKDGKCSIWVIRFRSEFVPETTFQLYANYHEFANIQLQRNENFNQVVMLCEIIFDRMQQPDMDYAVVKQLLGTLLTMIESERRKLEEQPDDSSLRIQNITFRNFLKILEENYRRPEGVEFYADKLFMSVRNLNLICQQIMQKSVSEMIETRKLIEAKNLLINTDKTISEIGFELGYNEKAYFTNVFKKKAGHTPSEFRAEMNKLLT
jgi:AraC-like DNA-binding protein